MDTRQFVRELESVVQEGRTLLEEPIVHTIPKFRRWRHRAESIVERANAEGIRLAGKFNSSSRQYRAMWIDAGKSADADALRKDLLDSLVELEFLAEQHGREAVRVKVEAASLPRNPVSVVTELCMRIPLVIRQLRIRHNERETLLVRDEYDLQDVLHALLHLFFEDVRPEEHTPSYAARSSRMDFLLKGEQIVVESKMTREGLSGREIGEQLIIDIARYKVHPDCKNLICLVYDPDHRINNPRGLERDLSRTSDGLHVLVLVVPRTT